MSVVIADKIKKLSELKDLCHALRQRGQKVVMCHGVFDLMHLGHIRHLSSAKKFGDVLVVTLTSDEFVKRGPGRPVFNHNLRAESLANLAIVDFVGIVEAPEATEAIESIKPDFYVKGPDYKNKSADVTLKIYEEEEAVAKHGGELVFTEDPTFSSSKLINSYLDTYPKRTSQYLNDLHKRYSAEDILGQLSKAKDLKILVIGDAILDQYHYCSPLNKSSKENIVVNKYLSEEDYCGGALATANHVAEVCDHVELLSVLGAEKSYENFIRGGLNHGIRAHFVLKPDCVTTVKRRYIHSENKQKLFEICFFDDSPLVTAQEAQVLEFLERKLSSFDLVIVSDFGHGMITARVMNEIVKSSKRLAINVQTNSANLGFNLVTKYPKAHLICIDEKEMRLAMHDKYKDLFPLSEELREKMQAEKILVTRGAQGAVIFDSENGIQEAPALAQKGIDAVGAGDAFFSYVSPAFALGMESELLTFIGNAAGALALQIIGNKEPVKFSDFSKFVTRLLNL